MGHSRGGPYTFRVSDSVEVPLRGRMLRLRLTEGTPSMSDVAVGRILRLKSPTGATRDLPILAHAVTGGNPTQKRLEQVRELDVIVDGPASAGDGDPVEIGWYATGPVE